MRGFGFFIGGRRLSSTAITGIRTPRFPAELEALREPSKTYQTYWM